MEILFSNLARKQIAQAPDARAGRLGVEPGETVFVGDSYAHDALAARAAGLRAVLLDPLDLYPEAACPRIRALGDLLPRAV